MIHAVEVETISVNWQTRTNWVYCEQGINKVRARDRRFTLFYGGGELEFQAGYILISYYQIISNEWINNKWKRTRNQQK